jgi:hypothetical protein
LKNLSNYDVISNTHVFLHFWPKNFICVPRSSKVPLSLKIPNIAKFYLEKAYGDIGPPLVYYRIKFKFAKSEYACQHVISKFKPWLFYDLILFIILISPCLFITRIQPYKLLEYNILKNLHKNVPFFDSKMTSSNIIWKLKSVMNF